MLLATCFEHFILLTKIINMIYEAIKNRKKQKIDFFEYATETFNQQQKNKFNQQKKNTFNQQQKEKFNKDHKKKKEFIQHFMENRQERRNMLNSAKENLKQSSRGNSSLRAIFQIQNNKKLNIVKKSMFLIRHPPKIDPMFETPLNRDKVKVHNPRTSEIELKLKVRSQKTRKDKTFRSSKCKPGLVENQMKKDLEIFDEIEEEKKKLGGQVRKTFVEKLT